MIRTDILGDKKCVHLKLTKETHLKLREKLFAYNISLQSVFDEFARLIVENDKRAIKIIEELVVSKALESLEKPVKRYTNKSETIQEIDHNTLYNMITMENAKRKKKNDDGNI